MDSFITIDKISKGEYRNKGSKFHAFLFPVIDEKECQIKLQAIRKQHSKANHHCYAFRLAANELQRCSDDGEPSSSAGRPILGILEKNDLKNVLCIVVRYFGGVKLGIRGLIDAYSGAAQIAVEAAELKKEWIYRQMKIQLEYSALGFMERFVEQNNIKVLEANFEAEVTQLIGIVPSRYDTIKAKLEEEIKEEFGNQIQTPNPIQIKPL